MMAIAITPQRQHGNHLLAALPVAEYQLMIPHLQHVSLSLGENLYEQNDSITHVYFPNDSVISLISTMESGATAEVGIIGREGMVGLPVFLGGDRALNQAVVQIDGTAMRMKVGAFRGVLDQSHALGDLLQLYTQARLIQTSQIAACNCFHRIEERLVRFLLSMHDRVEGDDVPLTHESISHMLGARRSGITVAAGKFQEARLIGYSRGKITILDRAGLEAASCECYGVVKSEFDRLLISNLAKRITSARVNTANVAPRRPDAGKDTEQRQHTARRHTERRHDGRRQADKEHEAALATLRDVNSRLLIAGIREQEARDKAEAANRAKDEFLGTISHELRTPLTAMIGWSRLLRARDFDKAISARALSIIERNAEIQMRLIEDLLNMSRIIAGKFRLDFHPLNLYSIVDAAVDGVRPEAEAESLEVLCVYDAEGVYVSGDAPRLQQIIGNLLTNAIKFTPAGGRVEVRVARSDSHAKIIVSDTGEGIAPEFLPHVFDRFRQADSSTTRTHGGLGLGLAIVRHLVELHGGIITVESPGKGLGASFTVELPVATNEAAANDPEQHYLPVKNDAAPFRCSASLGGLRVLLVEDDADTREVLTSTLEGCKAEVTAITNAGAALDAVAKVKPHVIVSDIGMPNEDGYELIRQLRAREGGERIPAAALTAYASEDDRTRTLAAGYQVTLSKPVEPSRLIAVVAHLAGRI